LPQNESLSVRQRYISLAVLVVGLLLYDPHIRFLDGEYMVTESAYEEMQSYLQKLNHHDLIVTDRIPGFLLVSDTENPYKNMDNGALKDGALATTVPYGSTSLQIDLYHLRFDSKDVLADLYGDDKARRQIEVADRLIFINTTWSSLAIEKLIHCELLDKTIVSFPHAGGREELTLLILSRDAFEKEVLAADGKAQICLTKSAAK
jgi:hypothetical protein